MAIEVTRHFDTDLSIGDRTNVEHRYTVFGTADETDAHNALAVAAPTLFDPWGSGLLFLVRSRMRLKAVGEELWECYVTYDNSATGAAFQFEVSGASYRIKHSIQSMGRWAPHGGPFSGQPAKDCHGLINVGENGAEGVELKRGTFSFSETHIKAASLMTEAYVVTLSGMVGTMNEDAFRGFAPGEVQFMAAFGNRAEGEDWRIQYRFEVERNAIDIKIGDGTENEIIVPTKRGWDYLWVYEQIVEDSTAKALTYSPVAAYVEQVLHESAFADLAI